MSRHSSASTSVEFVNVKRHRDALQSLSLATLGLLEPKALAESALAKILGVLNGERAYIYLCDDDQKLVLFSSRHVDGQVALSDDDLSRTVLMEAYTNNAPLVVNGLEEGASLGSKSAMFHNLKSIIASPLQIGDKCLGVIYINSRLARGMFANEDIGTILQSMAGHVTVSIESARLAQAELKKHDLEKDLEITAAVQALFMPTQPHQSSALFRSRAYYSPATVCGGDWWWHETLDCGREIFFLGDVTGHGTGPAMVTAAVSSFRNMIVDLMPDAYGNIKEMMGHLDRSLTKLFRTEYLSCLMVLDYDVATGVLKVYNAGCPPLFVHRSNQKYEIVHISGNPLGLGTCEMEKAK